MPFVTKCKCGRHTTLGLLCAFCLEGQFDRGDINEKAEPEENEFGYEYEEEEED